MRKSLPVRAIESPAKPVRSGTQPLTVGSFFHVASNAVPRFGTRKAFVRCACRRRSSGFLRVVTVWCTRFPSPAKGREFGPNTARTSSPTSSCSKARAFLRTSLVAVSMRFGSVWRSPWSSIQPLRVRRCFVFGQRLRSSGQPLPSADALGLPRNFSRW